MEKLKGEAQILTEAMKRAGKVHEVSRETSAAIDRGIAEGMKKAKQEFDKKERNSRAYMAAVELTKVWK